MFGVHLNSQYYVRSDFELSTIGNEDTVVSYASFRYIKVTIILRKLPQAICSLNIH